MPLLRRVKGSKSGERIPRRQLVAYRRYIEKNSRFALLEMSPEKIWTTFVKGLKAFQGSLPDIVPMGWTDAGHFLGHEQEIRALATALAGKRNGSAK
jgi:hypothetical protein